MFHGEKVRLRPIERSDLPTFVRWFADAELRSYLAICLPFSLAQEERWFEGVQERLERRTDVMLAIETGDGVHIGNIGLHGIEWKDRQAELGIAIGEKEYWGRGYGTDAVRTLLDVAFGQMNLHRVSLRVNADNPRAIRCYEKAGFRHEGTMRERVFRDGTYLDQHLMSVLDSEYDTGS
jgi:RimJ/RimL family protein N-acetyltransferase